MLLFDIGANKGDATVAGLKKGYKVIALEPAPRVYAELVKQFIYHPLVTPLRFAVSNSDDDLVEFYECVEDGLSTLNKDWLTSPEMPYAGKEFRTIKVSTITLDSLVKTYGEPDLIKIDVEGGEWSVFAGMTRKYKKLCFEWTLETLEEHEQQLDYLARLGYTEYAPQYIEHHLDEPEEWFALQTSNNVRQWHESHKEQWEKEEWKKAGLRPTADVGMIWVR